MKAPACLALVLVLVSSLTHAGHNSARRVRAFARLPDWTGLWETESSKAITHASGSIESSSGEASLVEFLRYFKLTAPPPYNPEWEQRYQAAMSDTAAAAAFANSFKGCGTGANPSVKSFPYVMDAPMVFQVVVTPEETLFVFDHGEVRHIYTDHRNHPSKEDLWPTPLGDSVGHWEGETLVIDTVARAPGPFTIMPVTLSEQAHFIERIRRADQATLEDQLTIEDPLRFTRPWLVTLRYSHVTDLNRFIPYECEADRNPIVDGKVIIAPQ